MVGLNTNSMAIFQKHLKGVEMPLQESKEKQSSDAQNIDNSKALKKGDEASFNSSHLIESSKFGANIKNINEFIGTLQSADLALSKMQKEGQNLSWLSNAYSDELVDGAQREELALEARGIRDNIEKIGENSKFKGASLFGETFVSSQGSNSVSVRLDKPDLSSLKFLDSSEVDGFLESVTLKRAEIKEAIKTISSNIENHSTSKSLSSYDFDKFDADLFKKLSKQ